MKLASELADLVSTLAPEMPGDLDALGSAGRALGIEWPPDYVAVMEKRDGGTGSLDGWPIHLWPSGSLVQANTAPRTGVGAGVVWFGWDGMGEDYGFERATGRVVLRAAGGEVEVFRDSLLDWIRQPPDFSDSRNEATRNLERAAARHRRWERTRQPEAPHGRRFPWHRR